MRGEVGFESGVLERNRMVDTIVYLIDDDPAVLHSTGFLLDSFGVKFEAFADPKAFLQSVGKLEAGYVITDLRMPEMDGFALRSTLIERRIGWPMILMTSDTMTPKGNEQAASFAACLRKPFTADELLNALDACSRLSGSAPFPGPQREQGLD